MRGLAGGMNPIMITRIALAESEFGVLLQWQTQSPVRSLKMVQLHAGCVVQEQSRPRGVLGLEAFSLKRTAEGSNRAALLAHLQEATIQIAAGLWPVPWLLKTRSSPLSTLGPHPSTPRPPSPRRHSPSTLPGPACTGLDVSTCLLWQTVRFFVR